MPSPSHSARLARLVSVLVVSASASCATSGTTADTSAAATTTTASAGSATSGQNTLTAAEQAAGWRLLFDGTTTTGWHGYKSAAMPNGWRVDNGLLMKDSSVADILTTDQFGDFEFAMDWRIGTGGNAGIFYRGTEEYEHIYWSAPEYQLLDDPNAPDGKNRLTSAAAAYGLYAAPAGIVRPAGEWNTTRIIARGAYGLYAAPAGIVRPAGEWNTTRIIARGAHVEHWLNGQKVVQYELWSPDWEAKVKASKFKDWPNYGRSKSGYLAIQGDHNGVLALRNIKIRTLP